MIIRGAIISEQSRLIGRRPRDVMSPASTESVPNPAFLPESAVDAIPIAGMVSAETLTPAAHGVRENPLSFEAVAAWLAVQDAQTRTACASVLADDLTQVHESAKEDGYAAGLEQGQQAAQRATDELRSLLREVASSAELAFAQEQERLAEQCVEIVSEALSKVAGPLLSSREAASGAVREVLKRVKEGRELTIRVNAADLRSLQPEQERLATALAGRKFSLVGDARVDIGGCIVESKLGSLDGRFEVQLRELYETLRAAKAAQADTP
jgi:flagellar assembly protein FliH